MVKYIVLHTDGTYRVHERTGALQLETIEDHLNGGYMTIAPHAQTRAGSKSDPRQPLHSGAVLLADEEGVIKQLPTNPWSFAVGALGFQVPWMFGGLAGPLLLVPTENAKGNFAGNLPACYARYLAAMKALDGADCDEDGNDPQETLLMHVQEHGTLPAKYQGREEKEKQKKQGKKRKAESSSGDKPAPKKAKARTEEANKEETSAPKEPRKIKTLHGQIMAHPRYEDINPMVRAEIEGCLSEFVKNTKENNAWSREIWRCLYRNQPMKDGSDLFAQ